MSMKFQAVSAGFKTLFICEICGCLETPSLGVYWSRNTSGFFDPKLTGKAMCSECTPNKFLGGQPSIYGKWHGKFIKKHVNEILSIYPGTEKYIINIEVLKTLKKQKDEHVDV